jgi:3-demethoxyubiquinol 3-hydroxylase
MASSRTLAKPLRSLLVRSTPSLYKSCIRTIATAPASVSTSEPPKKLKALTQEQRDFLDSAVGLPRPVHLIGD